MAKVKGYEPASFCFRALGHIRAYLIQVKDITSNNPRNKALIEISEHNIIYRALDGKDYSRKIPEDISRALRPSGSVFNPEYVPLNGESDALLLKSFKKIVPSGGDPDKRIENLLVIIVENEMMRLGHGSHVYNNIEPKFLSAKKIILENGADGVSLDINYTNTVIEKGEDSSIAEDIRTINLPLR
ncbi:MAG: hypothetical protein ACP5N3_06065 [Candidatus Nanoarchaeia archaeon]